jgi:hypothetical protein
MQQSGEPTIQISPNSIMAGFFVRFCLALPHKHETRFDGLSKKSRPDIGLQDGNR